jgi:predicted esterase
MVALLALHGFTQNGAWMRRQMGPLAERLGQHAALQFVDAPHECTGEVAKRLRTRSDDQEGKRLQWWNASEGGNVYEGWEETRDKMSRLIEGHASVGLIGFSQGAIVATAMAAWGAGGLGPRLDFVVLLGGAKPRSRVLAPLLAEPLALPSFHVWGDTDLLMRRRAPELVECFQMETRQVCQFVGGHEIPREGATADEIVAFVRKWE